MKELKDFQEANCRGCFYSDPEKVGTGGACCTFPGMPRIEYVHDENDRCLTRKEVKKSGSPGS